MSSDLRQSFSPLPQPPGDLNDDIMFQTLCVGVSMCCVVPAAIPRFAVKQILCYAYMDPRLI
jgi:hypothetical protein